MNGMPADDLIRDARSVFMAGVAAVQADRLLAAVDWSALCGRSIWEYRRILLLAVGKAAMAMAGVAELQLGSIVDAGLVVVPEGYADHFPQHLPAPEQSVVVEAGHPVPTEMSAEAGRLALELAAAAGADDLLLVLLSGGGSALCTALAPAITLRDARETFHLMTEAGVDIHGINTVRKHLSALKGGQLARAAMPGTVLALALSDVPGDDLSTIASGPTVPDPTTFQDAVALLRHHGLWDATPASIRQRLARGVSGAVEETPKPGHTLFERVANYVVGSNLTAREAAGAHAAAAGYHVRVRDDLVVGEARKAGEALAQAALAYDGPLPACLISGGETTVTVTGDGTGGRNQEVALAAALALDSYAHPIVLLCGGTDGVDGPTHAAGAWATPQTVAEAVAHGVDPRQALARNDSHAVFSAVDSLLLTGATHTNVMDLHVVLIGNPDGR